MNTVSLSSINILRRAAQNAVQLGHTDEARGIYRRLLKAIEHQYGKDTAEYADCLTEAGRDLHAAISSESTR